MLLLNGDSFGVCRRAKLPVDPLLVIVGFPAAATPAPDPLVPPPEPELLPPAEGTRAMTLGNVALGSNGGPPFGDPDVCTTDGWRAAPGVTGDAGGRAFVPGLNATAAPDRTACDGAVEAEVGICSNPPPFGGIIDRFPTDAGPAFGTDDGGGAPVAAVTGGLAPTWPAAGKPAPGGRG